MYAVRGVDLAVHESEVLGVVGESGSGKSVTMLAAMGLLPKTATITGSVKFRGHELLGLEASDVRHYRGSKIAMIFQDPLTALNPVLKVGDQIAEAVLAHQDVSGNEALGKAIQMLDLVGIPQPATRADQYPHEFSGGMRQRAMIAMAICNDPEVLIADEPTTALDVTIQAQILEVIQEVQELTKSAVVFITHDLGCDRPSRHSCPRAVRGAQRGGGQRRRHLREPGPPVHGRPDELDPARRRQPAAPHPWFAAEHARPADGLRVPAPLRLLRRDLRGRGAGAPRSSGRTTSSRRVTSANSSWVTGTSGNERRRRRVDRGRARRRTPRPHRRAPRQELQRQELQGGAHRQGHRAGGVRRVVLDRRRSDPWPRR